MYIIAPMGQQFLERIEHITDGRSHEGWVGLLSSCAMKRYSFIEQIKMELE